MTDLNKVILVGRLTRDCGSDAKSFGYLQNGTCMARISVAVNRSRKNEYGQWIDEANFFDVTIWGKTAENLKPYLLKGTQVAVEGYLKQDRWEKDGQKFSRVSVVANTIQLLKSPGDGRNPQIGSAIQNQYPVQNQHQAQIPNQNHMQPSGQYQDQSQYTNADFPEDIPF